MSTTDMPSAQQKMIPTVSSDVAGPLGVVHLPRLWAKLTLAAQGKLPDDYDECGPGFDQMTLNALKLDRQETIDYVRKNKPTYVQFEQWVLERSGGKIDPEAIRQHNDAVRGYNHSDELSSSMRQACGLNDESLKDAVTLNKLEDLHAFHQHVTGSGSSR